MKITAINAWSPVFDNDLSAWIPERWAQDALAQLEPNMAAAALVNRDFSDEVALFGETVTTRKIGKFVAKRKTDSDSVTKQDAVATPVNVTLNQHLHTSFIVKDGEESKGFPYLRQKYIAPAMRSIAQGLDEIILGQVYRFMDQSTGKLGTSPGRTELTQARALLNSANAPLSGRSLIITPNTEAALLDTDEFSRYDAVGDTEALKEGSLGRKFGWNIYMCQNTPSISTVGDTVSDTLDGAVAKGATSVKLTTGLTQAAAEGAWITIAGEMTPHHIIAYNATTKVATIAYPLKASVSSGAAVTIYKQAAVNNGAGYAKGWVKEVALDGVGTLPGKGRLISSGTSATELYSCISTDVTGSVLPDIPLETALVDDQAVGIGPAGEFNFGFVPDAIGLVMRPLALPDNNLANGAVAINEETQIGIRVVVTYDGDAQGHLVTCDMLAGIKVFDPTLGVVIYG